MQLGPVEAAPLHMPRSQTHVCSLTNRASARSQMYMELQSRREPLF